MIQVLALIICTFAPLFFSTVITAQTEIPEIFTISRQIPCGLDPDPSDSFKTMWLFSQTHFSTKTKLNGVQSFSIQLPTAKQIPNFIPEKFEGGAIVTIAKRPIDGQNEQCQTADFDLTYDAQKHLFLVSNLPKDTWNCIFAGRFGKIEPTWSGMHTFAIALNSYHDGHSETNFHPGPWVEACAKMELDSSSQQRCTNFVGHAEVEQVIEPIQHLEKSESHFNYWPDNRSNVNFLKSKLIRRLKNEIDYPFRRTNATVGINIRPDRENKWGLKAFSQFKNHWMYLKSAQSYIDYRRNPLPLCKIFNPGEESSAAFFQPYVEPTWNNTWVFNIPQKFIQRPTLYNYSVICTIAFDEVPVSFEFGVLDIETGKQPLDEHISIDPRSYTIIYTNSDPDDALLKSKIAVDSSVLLSLFA